MSGTEDTKGPSVRFPPPLIFLMFMMAGAGMHYIWPVSIGPAMPLKLIGGIAIVVALVVIVAISRVFKRVNTHIEPWKPTSKIVSTGLYSYSRNPIYVAFCLATWGLSFVFNSVWLLISIIPSVIAVYYLAIKKEEYYLEQKFGDTYLGYKRTVRRWL